MKIKIHGILGNIFGKEIFIKSCNINHVINILDSIKVGFRKKILDLEKHNQYYSIVVNQKNNTVNILPVISGGGSIGKFFGFILAAVLIVVGVIITPFFPVAGAFLVKLGIQTAISSAVTLVVSSLIKPTVEKNKLEIAVGGASNSTESRGKSYTFTNPQNTASQGSLVGIGYGKFRTGSKVIGLSLKSYPVNLNFEKEFLINENKTRISFYD